MSRSYDVLIIGGGTSGSYCAIHSPYYGGSGYCVETSHDESRAPSAVAEA